MKERLESDQLDPLRAANPVADDRLASASLARIRARVKGNVMTSEPISRQHRRARLAGLGSAIVAAGALALVIVAGRGAGPRVVPGGSSGIGLASCVEQYTPQNVANRAFAFDGTVSAIAGDRVTFTVGQAFRGVANSTITLDAPGMTGTTVTSAGGPNLTVGQRYLVAGDDRFVWACGFTQPYDAAVAAQWAAAVGG